MAGGLLLAAETLALQSSFAEWREGFMTQYPELPSELVGIIHDVRKRWRMKLALRGAAIAAGCVARGARRSPRSTLQWMRFTPESILLLPDPAGDGRRDRGLRCCSSGRCCGA